MLALLVGLVAGSGDIANTSIGWHLASGRLILAGHRVPHTDPFSFTSDSRPWLDHEWLFQVVVAVVEAAAGPAGLVLLRALLVAALAVLILGIGLRSGLDPPGALLLAALCLYGASIRFFLRPELATLLIAPAVLWQFVGPVRSARHRLLTVGGLMALGANLHAGVLVVPPLAAIVVAGRWVQWRVSDDPGPSPLRSRLPALAVAAAAPLLNPYGWRLYTVPLHIAHLVGLPHIPNPEWISPGPSDVPVLYVALAVALVVMAARERDVGRWLLLAATAVLALRYVRNVGLFFVLLPLASAPACGRLWIARPALRPVNRWLLATAAGVAVASALALVSGHSFGLSPTLYPIRAADFMVEHGLESARAYNDVRFGGYLIGRFFPPRQVFLDDRNEIHEPLLREVYELFERSDQAGWRRMLERYHLTVALLRYNQPFRVVSPSGEPLGERGFSALWFPTRDWALVYWDDTAMVLVERRAAEPALLESCEYRWIRPDDSDHLRRVLESDPGARAEVASELARKLAEEPNSRRALALSELLLALPR